MMLLVAALLGCTSGTVLRGGPSPERVQMLQHELGELDKSHTAGMKVQQRADAFFETSKSLFTEMSSAAEDKTSNLAPLLSHLRTAQANLAQVVLDVKSQDKSSAELYAKMLKDDDTDQSKQLLRNLQEADKANFQRHRRLAEMFEFRFKKAIHFIMKGDKAADKAKGLHEAKENLKQLMSNVK